MINEPTFLPGDLVEFELSQHKCPRWDGNIDHGGSGRWSIGIVEEDKGDGWIRVRSAYPGNLGDYTWLWHGPNSVNYTPEQWSLPGFLKHVDCRRARIYTYHDLRRIQRHEQATAIRQALMDGNWRLRCAAQKLGVTQGALHSVLRTARPGSLLNILWEDYRRTDPKRGRPRKPKS